VSLRGASYNARMTSMRIAGACMLLLGLAAIAAEPASPEKTGLAVGQQAPDFTLKDQNDRNVSLSALLKKGPVALVFFRSADW
jgi:cytochrome oxidase Cu insertion factor (SCO1/SenC/PrrC family)